MIASGIDVTCAKAYVAEEGAELAETAAHAPLVANTQHSLPYGTGAPQVSRLEPVKQLDRRDRQAFVSRLVLI